MEKLIIILLGIVVTITGYVIYRQREIKRLKEELLSLFVMVLNHMKVDWKKADEYAKIRNVTTYEEKGVPIYKYRTLTGDEIYMIGNNVIGHINKKKFSIEMDKILSTIFKEFTEHSVKHVNFLKKKHKEQQAQDNTRRKKATSNANYSSDSSSKSNQRKNTTTNTNTKSKNTHSTHPKWSLYEMLVKTANARKEHLIRVSKNDPSRANLENELRAVEGKIRLFKEKYKF